MKVKDKNIIVLDPIEVKRAKILIEGDGELVLNKMNARTIRALEAERLPGGGKKVKEVPNVWEDIITSMHWRDGYPMKDTYLESTEEVLRQMLRDNAPCITGFGLKKSFLQAVVRNEIDKYSTKFDSALNVVNRLEPITFAEHYVDTRLMSPKRGAPVLATLNHFTGWRSQVEISYAEHVYSLEAITNIINLAGFGLGIGSGRSSGYGRYHVVGIE